MSTIRNWSDPTLYAAGGPCYPSVANFPSMIFHLNASHTSFSDGALPDGSVFTPTVGAGMSFTSGTGTVKDATGIASDSWTYNGAALPVFSSAAKLLLLMTGTGFINPSEVSFGDIFLEGFRAIRQGTGVAITRISGTDQLSYSAMSPTPPAPASGVKESILSQFDISGNVASRYTVAGATEAVGIGAVTVAGTTAGFSSASITTLNIQLPSVGDLIGQVSLFALAAPLSADELKAIAFFQQKNVHRVCPLLYKRAAAA